MALPSATADVAILGAGIVGSAVAYFLSKSATMAGKRIVLVERDPTYAEASSARSAGGLRQQFSTPENIALAQATLAMFRTLQAEFGPTADVAFREQGYLLLASAAGRDVLADNCSLQRAAGADVALLDAGGLARRFPWLATTDIAAGVASASGEGWFDPASCADLLRRAAREHGVQLLPADAVALTLSGAQGHTITCRDGSVLACRDLVLAAGAWSGRLAATAGIPLPVEPRKRFVYVLDVRAPPAELTRAPLTVDPSGIWFRPEGSRFICGRSPAPEEEPPPVDLETIDHAFFTERIWPGLAARVPAFEAAKVVGAWAGYYDMNTLDHNAIVGPHPRIPGLYFACGFSGHGAMQGPSVGRVVAELITTGRSVSVDIGRLGYARIERGEPLLERNVI